MKIASITNFRVGQVWESHRNLYVVETAERFIKKTDKLCKSSDV